MQQPIETIDGAFKKFIDASALRRCRPDQNFVGFELMVVQDLLNLQYYMLQIAIPKKLRKKKMGERIETCQLM